MGLNPVTTSNQKRSGPLLCYRYYAWDHEYDAEAVWAWVQAQGGHIELRRDCIDYYVPESVASFFVIRYSQLVRQPQLDYC